MDRLPFKPEMIRAIQNTRIGIYPASPIDPHRPYKGQTRRLLGQPTAPRSTKNILWNAEQALFETDPESDCTWKSRITLGGPAAVGEQLRMVNGAVTYGLDGERVLVDGQPVTWTWKIKSLPPRYMPNWAARYFVEAQAEVIESLHALTEAEAQLEGCQAEGTPYQTARQGYILLWDKINPKAPFSTNPFVRKISFRRIKPPSVE